MIVIENKRFVIAGTECPELREILSAVPVGEEYGFDRCTFDFHKASVPLNDLLERYAPHACWSAVKR